MSTKATVGRSKQMLLEIDPPQQQAKSLKCTHSKVSFSLIFNPESMQLHYNKTLSLGLSQIFQSDFQFSLNMFENLNNTPISRNILHGPFMKLEPRHTTNNDQKQISNVNIKNQQFQYDFVFVTLQLVFLYFFNVSQQSAVYS